MDYSATSIPRPKDWQAFERACRVLFECILDDPLTQLNGRSGQDQNGVDIFGRRSGNGPHVGIQCKGKEGKTYGKQVSETELRKEVKKALTFEPRISDFILVTTANNDAKIQKVARLITEENANAGQHMTVAVWGWEELETRIGQYPVAIKAFHPDVTAYTQDIISGQVRIETKIEAGIDENRAQVADLLSELSRLRADIAILGSTSGSSAKEQSESESILHKRIDSYRNLITSGQSKTALGLLRGLRGEIWEKASSRIKFRIETNIGAALLRLKDEKEAAELFLSAIEYDPKDKVGLANVTLAYLIKKEPEKAIIAGKEALRHNPENEDAACYLIQASFADQAITDPFEIIPERIRKSQGVTIGAIFFQRRRGMPQWRELAKKAAERFPQAEEIKRLWAESILDSLCASRWVMLGHSLSTAPDLKAVDDVASTLQEQWDRIKKSEDKPDVSLPHNLSVAYRLLGRYGDAARVLDEALEISIEDHLLLKLRAIIHLSLKEEEKALRLLREKRTTDPELGLMTAELLLKDDPVAARAIVSELIDRPGIDPEYRMSAFLGEIETYISENQREIALEKARRLVSIYPDRVEPAVALAHILHDMRNGSSDEILSKARDLITEDSSFLDRFLIAKELYGRDRVDEVIELLENHVDMKRDTPALQLFLSALKESDQRKRAFKWIKKLSPEISAKPWYLRLQAAIHINRGDYPSAQKTLDTYLELFPDDLVMRNAWLGLVYRRPGGAKIIKDFLEGKVEDIKGDPVDRMQIAFMLSSYGFEERAVKLGYRLFMDNPNNAEVHARYMALLLRPDKSTEMDLVNIEKVGPDTAFVIQNDRGEKKDFIIEDEEELRKDPHYIASGHELAKRAAGLRVGDSFTMEMPMGPAETWRVESIKHKHIDCLHKSMENFNIQFPTFQGFQKVPFDPGEPKAILEPIKAQHDLLQSLMVQFEKAPVSIFILAEVMGTDAIKTWYSLVGSKNKFRVALGTVEERNTARQLVLKNSAAGCVTDALTFYLIRRLGIEGAVTEMCGRIGMTQTSIDVFRQKKEEIELHGDKPYLMISYRDGNYLKEEIAAERLRRAVDEVNQDLLWIENNCDILPAENESGLSPASRQVAQRYGRTLFDTILAAGGSKRILLCEDFHYRLMATQNERIPSVWLQPVLMIARDQGIISQEKYDDAVYLMLEWGFIFTSVESGNIIRAALSGTDPEGMRFNKMVSALGGPEADMRSHIGVAVDVLNVMWKKSDPPLKIKAQTGQLLEYLLNCKKEDFEGTIQLLKQIGPRYGFQRYFQDWLRGHFFIK